VVSLHYVFATFQSYALGIVILCAPCRRPYPLDAFWIFEHLVRLFKWPPGRFYTDLLVTLRIITGDSSTHAWEKEKDMNRHHYTKYGEYQVLIVVSVTLRYTLRNRNTHSAPFDVHKSWWNKVSKCKVEYPIPGCRQCHSSSSQMIRV
jgi:hypothetical protein